MEKDERQDKKEKWNYWKEFMKRQKTIYIKEAIKNGQEIRDKKWWWNG